MTPSGGSQRNIPITLNSAFGTINHTGKTVTPPQGGTGNGHAVEIDQQGNIYVAGSFTNTSTGAKTFAVTKFLPNGSRDTAYGSNGTLTIDFGAGDEIAYDIELYKGTDPVSDPATLYVAGTASGGWAVAKLVPDGTGQIDVLDDNFDGDGRKSGFRTGQLNAVHYHQDAEGSGNILLAGADTFGTMYVYALNSSTGATAWSRDIVFNIALYGWQEGFDVLEQVNDDKVVVAGMACRSTAPYGTDFALARLNSDGTFDSSFDGDGKVTTNISGLTSSILSQDIAYSIVESADHDALFAVGKSNTTGSDRFAVVSYLRSNGSRDPEFKMTGYSNGVAIGPSGVAYDAKVQHTAGAPGFGMVVAGGTGVPGDTSNDFVLARFVTHESLGTGVGGALDTQFGSSGVATTDFNNAPTYNSGYDVARGIDFAFNADESNSPHQHSIVAAGFSGTGVTGGNLALAEYLPSNRILVVSSSGGAPAPPPPGGGAALSLSPWDVDDEDEEADAELLA